MTTVSTRVLVVDDDPLVRSALALMLGGQPDLEVVGEAADGREALRRVDELRPGVVLMDIRMPRMSGLEATRDLHELLDNSLRLCLDYFNSRVAWVGLRLKPEGELEVLAGRLRSGQSCGTNAFIELLQYRCVERNQHICLRKIRDDAEIGSAMGVPLNSGRGTLGMLYVDRRAAQKRFQIPDLDLFSTLAAHVAVKADLLLQQRAQRSAAITTTEVSVVHSIQAHLDPSSAPHLRGYQLAAYSRPGQDKPGDLYDVVKHPDTSITGFLMGHVNSTGAHLALSIARLHSTFRVGFIHNDPPHALARADEQRVDEAVGRQARLAHQRPNGLGAAQAARTARQRKRGPCCHSHR